MVRVKRLFALTGLVTALTDILLMLTSFGAYPFIFVLTVLSVLICAFFARKYLYTALTVMLSALLAVTVFAHGFFTVYRPALTLDGVKTQISGRVKDYPEGGSVLLEDCVINGTETELTVRVYVPGGFYAAPGDTLSIPETTLSCVKADGNIFFWHTLSSGACLNCTAFYTPWTLTENAVKSPLNAIRTLRYNCGEKLRNCLSESAAAMACALITGSREGIPDDMAADMKISGVSHVFAISGMHLAMWSAVIFLIFRKGSRSKKIPLIAAVLFVSFYAVFTGFSPSVLRSAIMLICVYAGGIFKRKADAANSLGLAVTLMLTVNPFYAGNVSFLLSAAATAAIVALYPMLFPDAKKPAGRVAKKLHSAGSAILVSLAVIFLTVPVTALFFGYVSLLSPVSSVLCTPLAEGIMMTAGAGLFIPGKAAAPVFTLCEVLCRVLDSVLSAFASLTFAVCPADVKTVLPWFFITLLLIVFFSFSKKNAKERVTVVCLASSLLIVSFATGSCLANKGNVRLYFPQAGSATCFALTDESRSCAMIIGAGGNYASARELTTFLDKSCIFSDVCVIIPRRHPAENGAEKYLDPLRVKNGFIREESAAVSFFDGDTFVYGTNCQPFGTINVNGTKIFVCWSPAADFTGADVSGDILICRAYIPDGLCPGDYEKIIVMSEKSGEKLALPGNALSTADGDITLKLKQFRDGK